MSFVQINIAPAATTIPNPAVAYRSAIANLAAAEAAGEIIDDQVASLAAAFDLDVVSVQAEINELLSDLMVH